MRDLKSFLRLFTNSDICCGVVLVGLILANTGAHAVEPEVPYDLEKFRPVLDDSKLQVPKSSPAMIKRGEFEGARNEYFFLDETRQYMTFSVTGDSHRSELRQLSGEWDTVTSTPERLVARVKVYVPEDPGLEQFTFLQIHDTTNDPNSLNKPLLRVTRRGNYRGTTDHLWAQVRTPNDFKKPISKKNLATQNFDLGPRPEGFFDAEIIVQDSTMKVLIEGNLKVDMDVSYWDGLKNYFKAGVYNQDPGTAKVEFESLYFLDSDQTPGISQSSRTSDASAFPTEEPE